ncbi:ATP-binding cassette, subfamily B [Anaeromicropila populeti]|uniref:ATP-binding cassette, subfamily B n=2 Tax=Anaeromicropila populeti TaxID=37658 RepID=A0A1I6K799_9FIRM|nr:ATP-binding cassette, subfamily B [Anaeromicropila populeti]
MREKEKSKKIFEVFKVLYHYTPVATFILILNGIVSAITPTIQVICEAYFLDCVTRVLLKKQSVNSIYISVGLISLLLCYQFIMPIFMKLHQTRVENSLRKDFRTKITKRKSLLLYRYIDNSKTMDLIERVVRDCEKRQLEIFTDTMNLANLILRCLGIILILFVRIWWVTLVITAITIPLFILAMKSGKANYEASVEVTKISRRYNYFKDVLIGKNSVPERALFGYGKKMNAIWMQDYEKARKTQLRTEKLWFFKMKAGGVITACISILVLFPLMYETKQGLITIGMFIALTNAIFNLIQEMSWNLTAQMDKLAKNQEYMREYTEFFNLETEDETHQYKGKEFNLESIEFKNVKFKYPTSECYILNGVSFKVEKGKHYAFVGKNGSGKTTIIKLLTGLYRDYEGEILVNDKSLKDYTRAEINAFCSVVFQDFAKYSLTIRDNIALGDINNIHEKTLDSRIDKIMEDMDLKGICNTKDGINMLLGKIKEGGVDLSGGEWQKLVMARGAINNSPLKILDEPTSALDPINESEMYRRFEKISKNNTVILISHRLGSTYLADKIFVLDEGKIVEQGEHEYLMGIGKLYYNMYNMQRSWYI